MSLIARASVLLLVCSGLTGCGFFPSDPTNPDVGVIALPSGQLEVKIPLCPGTSVTAVSASVFAKEDGEPERPMWRASGFANQIGVIVLGEKPASGKASGSLPSAVGKRYLAISWSAPQGGPDTVVTLADALKSAPPTGEFWTWNGARSAAWIDSQLHC